MEKQKLTDLSEIGEFGLIHRIKQNVEIKNASTIKGIDDDSAVLDLTNAKTLVTNDLLIEGVHFDLTYTPIKHLGYKSVIVNLSDIYAMNGKPSQILVSIAVSSRFTLEAIDAFYEGVHLACKLYGVDLVGGDTTSSQKGMMISVTAIGQAQAHDIAYRNTAKPNQLICVSGDLGSSYMGLQLLEREKIAFSGNQNVQPDFAGYDYLLERQLKPEARAEVIELLQQNNIKIHAMMDVSDGLSSELLHICNQSGVGCKVFEDKLPIHEQTRKMADELNIDPTIAALNGGEDYELLFTVDITDLKKLEAIEGIHVIGHITETTDKMLIHRSGQAIPIVAQGWNALT